MAKPKNILVIDDNKLLVNMIADLFRAINFNVTIATDYNTAIARAREDIDMIVVDFWLDGEKTGADFTKEIKADPDLRHIPIIGISGAGKEDVCSAFLKAGADGFLKKPLKNPPLYLYTLGLVNEDK